MKFIRFTNKYIKENLGKSILVNGIIFVAFVFISFFAVKAVPEETMKEILKGMNEIFDGGTEKSFWDYFIHNTPASFYSCLLGFIPFLFLSVINNILNASAIGALLAIAETLVNESAILFFVKAILPHGIFEIPAMVLGFAMGTKICMFLCRKICGKAKDEKMLYHIKGCASVFVLYSIPLFFIAGIIEASLPLF